MDNTSVLSILSISDSRCEGDIHIESCGEFSNELNGYSVILRKERRDDFIGLVSNLFGEANASVLKDVIDVEEVEDPDDAADLCKLCLEDGFENYTEAFLEFYGSPSAIIEKFSSENTDSASRKFEEESAVVVDVLEEQIESLPEVDSRDLEIVELKNEISRQESLLVRVNDELEKTKVDLKDIGDKYISSLEEIEAKESNLSELKETYCIGEVPEFAVELMTSTLDSVNEKDSILAMKLLVQDYSSSEKNYLLANLINDLLTKFSELEVISFE